MKPTPDFNNLLAVLKRKRPSRPTLFEFFMNDPLYAHYAGPDIAGRTDELAAARTRIWGFADAGYDYANIYPWPQQPFVFPRPEFRREASLSLNEGAVITDRASFEAYPWPDPENTDFSSYDALKAEIPDGMKLVACACGGVLEITIQLVGFEQLCILTMTDPDLVKEIFDAVGSRLLRYYRIVSAFDIVGACVGNDDWGFKTQTMLSPEMMRTYVFPWHKKIVQAIHAAGKPAILHSCGNLEAVYDDLIDNIGYDAKHSYEDTIIPVEKAYERWGRRIAVVGGIDVDFLIRGEPDAIRKRCFAMLERSADRGGYALGSGNSIPEYVPMEKFEVMVRCVREFGG
jgi:uroporphyrinogen decarboxylase